MCYLHRVIVEIGHNYFILVVHGNKVRTCVRRERKVNVGAAVIGTETDACGIPFTVSRLFEHTFQLAVPKDAIMKPSLIRWLAVLVCLE